MRTRPARNVGAPAKLPAETSSRGAAAVAKNKTSQAIEHGPAPIAAPRLAVGKSIPNQTGPAEKAALAAVIVG